MVAARRASGAPGWTRPLDYPGGMSNKRSKNARKKAVKSRGARPKAGDAPVERGSARPSASQSSAQAPSPAPVPKAGPPGPGDLAGAEIQWPEEFGVVPDAPIPTGGGAIGAFRKTLTSRRSDPESFWRKRRGLGEWAVHFAIAGALGYAAFRVFGAPG